MTEKKQIITIEENEANLNTQTQQVVVMPKYGFHGEFEELDYIPIENQNRSIVLTRTPKYIETIYSTLNIQVKNTIHLLYQVVDRRGNSKLKTQQDVIALAELAESLTREMQLFASK